MAESQVNLLLRSAVWKRTISHFKSLYRAKAFKTVLYLTNNNKIEYGAWSFKIHFYCKVISNPFL